MSHVSAPLIVHVVYSFHTGGLENGLVNLIRYLPQGEFRHVIVSLTNRSPKFSERLSGFNVEFIELNKPPGHGVKLYPRLNSLFRELSPDIVHTRNLAALEAQVPAWLAGVPVRIHGEHGWDVSDPEGRKLRFRLVRRFYKPFVGRYVALSAHLERYLKQGVGVPEARITRICNGVDIDRFSPASEGRALLIGSPFNATELRVIGTVGRLQAIKDQLTLVQAFAHLLQSRPQASAHLRLMIVGEGGMRPQLEKAIATLGLRELVWLAGERSDVPDVMRAMNVFVLPSRAEGISNTILEAMASGLPVVATDVGGNGELVDAGNTGLLVPPAQPEAMAEAIASYVLNDKTSSAVGRAARARAAKHFSIARMVTQYRELYIDLLNKSSRCRRIEPDTASR